MTRRILQRRVLLERVFTVQPYDVSKVWGWNMRRSTRTFSSGLPEQTPDQARSDHNYCVEMVQNRDREGYRESLLCRVSIVNVCPYVYVCCVVVAAVAAVVVSLSFVPDVLRLCRVHVLFSQANSSQLTGPFFITSHGLVPLVLLPFFLFLSHVQSLYFMLYQSVDYSCPLIHKRPTLR